MIIMMIFQHMSTSYFHKNFISLFYFEDFLMMETRLTLG